MKSIETILSSGIINDVKFNETFQTADSNVYSFRFETTDEDVIGASTDMCRQQIPIIMQ